MKQARIVHIRRLRHLLPLFILLQGCIHEYPVLTADGEEGVDPTMVKVNLHATLMADSIPTQPPPSPEYHRRFIIEIQREGKTIARQTYTASPASLQGSAIDLPVSLNLHALPYRLVVWSDYTLPHTSGDLHYDTGEMQGITCTEPYTGNTPLRDCHHATLPLDLRRYRHHWNKQLTLPVKLKRPLAKYEIIATDIREFLRQHSQEETLSITYHYHSFLPTVFDANEDAPCDGWLGMSYTVPLPILHWDSTEQVIGSDFLFASPQERTVQLSITLQNREGEVLSHTPPFEIPYRRGYLTRMRGDFLTDEASNGFHIKTEYDEIIPINLDSLSTKFHTL